MKIFLDTADADEVAELARTGLVDGVTTNPSLILKSGRDMVPTIRRICELVPGPVSAEVASEEVEAMLAEGLSLAQIAPNVVVKLPMTFAGLRVCQLLSARQIKTNITLCFSASQALLAAKAGATYVSPFVGRLDDSGVDGLSVVRDILTIYRAYPELETQVLVASVRKMDHVIGAARMGAEAMTCSPAIFKEMIVHPLTEKGLVAFAADWAKTGQMIAGVQR